MHTNAAEIGCKYPIYENNYLIVRKNRCGKWTMSIGGFSTAGQVLEGVSCSSPMLCRPARSLARVPWGVDAKVEMDLLAYKALQA